MSPMDGNSEIYFQHSYDCFHSNKYQLFAFTLFFLWDFSTSPGFEANSGFFFNSDSSLLNSLRKEEE